jgi:predicted phage tail protein
MHAHFVHLKDPFRPTVRRDFGTLVPGHRISHILQRKKLIVNGKRVAPYVVLLNGKPVLQKRWNQRIRDKDVLTVSHLPRGGGKSNPLQIVAMVALIVVSVYTGGAATAAYGALFGAVASSAVMLGGSLLLNMLFKPPSTNVSSGSQGAVSPTYSLTSQGNMARLLQAIPVLYGRMLCTPDFAAEPYTEIQGTDQYLYQLFCLTQGQVDIEQILVGGTDISAFPDVQIEIVQPYQQVTLFPTNVDTSTSVASQILYGINNAAFAVIGPFVTNLPGTTANFLSVDISLPNGAYKVDDSGNMQNTTVSYQFQYQQIDDSGNTLGPWNILATDSLTLATNQPQRKTYKVAVPAGRYQVRGQRLNNDANGITTQSDTVQWDVLRAYLTEPSNYGNVTLIATIMKATNTLTATSSRDLTVLATRMLNTWDPVNGWTLTPTPTQNPAWALADVIKNPDYGRNLPDSSFNIEEVYRLAEVWDTRGDTFNFLFDSVVQLWDALTTIAKVGRAMPMYYAGLIDFIRNEPATIPTAMFSPQNMLSGSFSTTYQFADVDTPDYVQIQYIDEETWQQATVDCVLPGGTQNTPAVITLDGCTNHDQAWREGITMAAVNRDQRRIITFNTELEGYLPRYGDLVQISHDVPAWGTSGRVLSFDPTTQFLQGSEDFLFPTNETYVVAFRKRDGSADGPYTVVPSWRGITNEVQVLISEAQAQQIYISDGIREEFTLYQFGATTRAGLLGQCMSAQPDGDGNVQLSFVNYADSVFVAETGGAVPIPPPVSNLPLPPNAPIIDQVTLQYSFVVGQQTIVATPANGAQYYEFQVSPDGGVTWISLGTNTDPQQACALNVGTWLIRVRGVGLLTGAWTTISVNVLATTLPLVAIGSFSASNNVVFGVTLNWTIQSGNGGIAKKVQLWTGLSNALGNAVLLGEFAPTTTTYTQTNMGPGETHFYWARVVDQAGRNGPWFNNGTAIVGQSSSDTTKILAQLGGQISETMLAQSLQTKIDAGANAAVQLQQTTTDLAAMYTIKTQLSVDGKTYMAGIGVGVENNQGILESQVLVSAGTFAIIDPTVSGGAVQYPFIVTGGVAYMSSAFIQNASITNAMIGNTIQSNAVNPATGQPVWLLDKNGTFAMNGTGTGRLVINNSQVLIYDTNNVLRVAMGLNI